MSDYAETDRLVRENADLKRQLEVLREAALEWDRLWMPTPGTGTLARAAWKLHQVLVRPPRNTEGEEKLTFESADAAIEWLTDGEE